MTTIMIVYLYKRSLLYLLLLSAFILDDFVQMMREEIFIGVRIDFVDVAISPFQSVQFSPQKHLQKFREFLEEWRK